MQRVIEALESRIAPAAVFTYTEADGDVVTVKTTAKVTNDYFESLATIEDGRLSYLDLSDKAFKNTSLTISVNKVSLEGLASIGSIYSTQDLKNVTINGNLDAIAVGDGNIATPALSTLQVQNLGAADSSSYFLGNVKAVKILGNLSGSINGGGFLLGGIGDIGQLAAPESYGLGNIGVLKVGGSIEADGQVAARNIGTLTVGGDVQGDVFARVIKAVRVSGDIDGGTILGGSIKSVRVSGDILGGSDSFSGGIAGLAIGNVIVGGNIKGDVSEDAIESGFSGFVAGFEIGKVTVLGNVEGGNAAFSGIILGLGDVGSIRIDGSLLAGAGISSGSIASGLGGLGELGEITEGFGPIGSLIGGEIGKIVIKGSVNGSYIQDVEGVPTDVSGDFSGSIKAIGIGSLRVAGDVAGGAGINSGSVSGIYLTSAVFGGDILGGAGYNSGIIDFEGIGNLRVVENVIGGTGVGSASIVADHGIGTIKIGGNVTAQAHNSASIAAFEGDIESVVIGGTLSNTLEAGEGFTGIYAGGSIGRVTIGGGASGGDYGTLGIRAASGGFDEFPSTFVPTIGSVTVKGDASNFMIESGLDLDGVVRYWATIGSVNITGNFNTSSISAGISAGPDRFYGTGDDLSLNPGVENLTSRIASVLIGGTASGTPAVDGVPADPANLDNYGIFAGHIVSLKVAGAKQALKAGAGNDLVTEALSGSDVFYKEVPILVG